MVCESFVLQEHFRIDKIIPSLFFLYWLSCDQPVGQSTVQDWDREIMVNNTVTCESTVEFFDILAKSWFSSIFSWTCERGFFSCFVRRLNICTGTHFVRRYGCRQFLLGFQYQPSLHFWVEIWQYEGWRPKT
jgi:hypothetical protein